MSRQIITQALCIVLVLFVSVGNVLAAPVTDEEVGKRIDELVEFLINAQNKEGHWDDGNKSHAYNSGKTALVMTALLYAGVSPQHPKLQKAIEHLRTVKLEGTYQVALHAHVYAHMNDAYLDDLKKVMEWLELAQCKEGKGKDDKARLSVGTYGYSFDVEKEKKKTSEYYKIGGKGGDHSNTQYGILGMWECVKRFGRSKAGIDAAYWDRVVDHFVHPAIQSDSGGWGYNNKGGGIKPTMTCAGLTALLVAQQERHRDRMQPDARIEKAITKGMEWMDDHFKRPGSGGYYWVGIERIALGLGYKYIGDKDWYTTGCQSIFRGMGNMRKKMKDGNADVVNPSFYLMFLSRGRVPVWCTKLQVPGQRWNNRPNDVYFITRALSHLREGEINWQVIDIDRPAGDLLSAPVLYLSSASPINFSDEQVKNLKRYLDLGGLLVCNSELSTSFSNSIHVLAKKLYPETPFKRVAKDHPLFTALFDLSANAPRIGASHVNNGARDLIILFDDDMGGAWQREDETEVMEHTAGKIAANLYTFATNRGVIPNRLIPRFERVMEDKSAKQQIELIRPQYKGNWLPEPGVWERVNNRLVNDSEIGLAIKGDARSPIELKSIGDAKAALVHMQGIEKVTLTKDELGAIRDFVKGGGTVLIEQVGGRGQFAYSLETQLRSVLNARAVPMQPGDNVISGEGLPAGADCTQIAYRRYTQVKMKFGRNARIMAFYLDGRPSVLVSEEDLSLGALRVPRWGIIGYEPDSALDLMGNIVKAAHVARGGAKKD